MVSPSRPIGGTRRATNPCIRILKARVAHGSPDGLVHFIPNRLAHSNPNVLAHHIFSIFSAAAHGILNRFAHRGPNVLAHHTFSIFSAAAHGIPNRFAHRSPNGANHDSPGQRPGSRATFRARALKGRPNSISHLSSIPNVLFVKLDTMAIQELPIFLLERLFGVMFALARNVGANGRNL